MYGLQCCRSALVDRHEGLADSIQGEAIADARLLEVLLQEVRIADAIYEKSTKGCVLLQSINLLPFDMFKGHNMIFY